MRAVCLFFALLLPAFCATRRAVLIGIDRYNPQGEAVSTAPAKRSASRKGLAAGDVRHWKYVDLEGVVNDVNLVAGLLLAPEFGFQPNDIVKLVTPETTTADEILATLRKELVDTASAGDVRLVYYSGHGNFIRNTALKNTRNEFDQTIVPSDHWQGAVDVRDKEIARILWDAAKKGVRITFVADSCHSGSLTRGPLNTRGRSRSNSGVTADFAEPAIDDPASIDNSTGKEIDPEGVGVLTLAAAQENQEALEIWDEKDGTHGGMTLALVRALREEGPHASMNRIFERMLNYMQATNLSQTPVLGGKGRGELDLLGDPAKQEPFSVLVKEVRGDEAQLRAGEAIGLYEGSELTRVGGGATLLVTKSLGLTQSAATIGPAGAKVSAGDRFEVTKWASPQEPVLRVYVPPSATAETISQAVERFAALRNDPSVHWVDDPAKENPDAFIRWNGEAWVLDAGGKAPFGRTTGVTDLKMLPKGARVFVLMPPTTELAAAIQVGEGTRYSGIARVDAAKADYRLYGKLTPAGVQYAWVKTDAALAAASSMPARTDWFAGPPEQAGGMLTEYAVRIGKVHGWLTLSGRPGNSPFPYRLMLRKTGTKTDVRSGTLYGGDKYKLFLQLDPAYKSEMTPRRWVYVFAIDQKGDGTLLFPRVDSGNEGNHLPRAEKDEAPMVAAVRAIPLTEGDYDLEVSEPWGTDTYIVISTKEAIPNPKVFQFEGVQTARGAEERGHSGNALQDLLDTCGEAARGMIASKAPAEWSIERLAFQSAPKN